MPLVPTESDEAQYAPKTEIIREMHQGDIMETEATASYLSKHYTNRY